MTDGAHLSPIGRLPVREKLSRLVKLARTRKRGLVLTHDNPDPDSMASAVALATLLQRKVGLSTQVAYGGIIGRAENIAFVRELKLPVDPISKIVFDDYDLLALVDTQQNVGNHALPVHLIADIVIDHHPLRTENAAPVAFSDVGNTGATSTLLTQYLRAARIEPGSELATALYYGIKADTRDLERQTRNPDVDSYLWLFPKIDRDLLAKIEHPDVPARYFQMYHAAIERAKVFSSAVITDLGEVYSPDMVAEVAERLSFLDSIVWSLAYGSYRSQLYLSLRVSDRRMRAGKLIRDLTQDLGGSAGGHGSMAGARLPLHGTRQQRLTLRREVLRRFKESLGIENERGTSLLSSADKQ